jgi:tight adherence protein C
MSDLELLSVLACCGLAAMLAWAALRHWLKQLPVTDRRYRSQAPALWRFGGPLMRWLSRVVASVLPRGVGLRLGQQLQRAGLDAALTGADFVAGRLTVATVLACVGAALVAGVGNAGWASHSAASGGADSSNDWVWLAMACGALLGWLLPVSWLREQRAARVKSVGRALPFYLDVITLSVESGANLTGALQYAVAKGPMGPLREEMERVLTEVRTGRTRAEALRAMAHRLDLPAVSNWVAALVGAEKQGSSLGPILRAQAEQRRQERFQLAEKLAMKAPVKMLFPLLIFIFPCTFVLLLFPVAVRLLQEGVLK